MVGTVAGLAVVTAVEAEALVAGWAVAKGAGSVVEREAGWVAAVTVAGLAVERAVETEVGWAGVRAEGLAAGKEQYDESSSRAAGKAYCSNRCTIAGISETASGTGTSRWTPSGRSEGARSGMPVRVEVPRRPMCVICETQRAPWAWTPSASARSAGSLRSSHSAIEPYDAAVVGSTQADPTSSRAASTGRLADVVVHLAPIDQAVAAPARGVGRGHDPVAQHLPAQLQR